jgi:hypothetical protein
MRNVLVATAAIALLVAPIASASAEPANAQLTTIDYLIASQNKSYSVTPGVYAAYVGSCLNADATTPSVDADHLNAVYVCVVRPKVVAEMQELKFIPTTVGYRATHDVRDDR